jgi:hypothetical protein
MHTQESTQQVQTRTRTDSALTSHDCTNERSAVRGVSTQVCTSGEGLGRAVMVLVAKVEHAREAVVQRHVKAVVDDAHYLLVRQGQKDGEVNVLLTRRFLELVSGIEP